MSRRRGGPPAHRPQWQRPRMRGCVRTRDRIAKPRWRWVRIGHAKRTSELATWEMRLKKLLQKKQSAFWGVFGPHKHENVFTKVRSQRRILLVYHRAQRVTYAAPYFKVTARTRQREPRRFCFLAYSPLKRHNKNAPKYTFFRYSARSPHRATKPSRGWLRVVVRKPRLVLFEFRATRN